eukprot:m.417295 g.417295  ORF g.417295 m.417295 type:complete len:602 (-) comp30357_c0_seq1:36-1841(-)
MAQWLVYIGSSACPTAADIAQMGIVMGASLGTDQHVYFSLTEAHARAFVHSWPSAQPHKQDRVRWDDAIPDPPNSWIVFPGYDPANPGLPPLPATCRDNRYWWSWCSVKGKPHALHAFLVFNLERDALAFTIARPVASQNWPYAQNPHEHCVDGYRDAFTILTAREAAGGTGALAVGQFLVSHDASFARLRLVRPRVWQSVATTPLNRLLSAVADTAQRRSGDDVVGGDMAAVALAITGALQAPPDVPASVDALQTTFGKAPPRDQAMFDFAHIARHMLKASEMAFPTAYLTAFVAYEVLYKNLPIACAPQPDNLADRLQKTDPLASLVQFWVIVRDAFGHGIPAGTHDKAALEKTAARACLVKPHNLFGNLNADIILPFKYNETGAPGHCVMFVKLNTAADDDTRLRCLTRLQCLLYILRNRAVHGLEAVTIFRNRASLYGEVDVPAGGPIPDVFTAEMFEFVRFTGVSAADTKPQRRVEQRLLARVSVAILDPADANHGDPLKYLDGTPFNVFRANCTPHLVLNELVRKICPPGRWKRPPNQHTAVNVASQQVVVNNIVDGPVAEKLQDWQWEQCLYLVQFLAASVSEAIHRIAPPPGP